MPDNTDAPAPAGDPVVLASPGLVALLAEARETWIARARDADKPGWRPFEDAFPTFYQFTNRPR
jgi:hypothetical protein